MNAILPFRLVWKRNDVHIWNLFCICHQIRTTHNSFARQTLFEFDSKKAEKDDDVFHFVRQEALAYLLFADPCRIPVKQCFGSGLDRFKQVNGSGSVSRRSKMIYKNRKKVKKFHVLKCWMFSFER